MSHVKDVVIVIWYCLIINFIYNISFNYKIFTLQQPSRWRTGIKALFLDDLYFLPYVMWDLVPCTFPGAHLLHIPFLLYSNFTGIISYIETHLKCKMSTIRGHKFHTRPLYWFSFVSKWLWFYSRPYFISSICRRWTWNDDETKSGGMEWPGQRGHWKLN